MASNKAAASLSMVESLTNFQAVPAKINCLSLLLQLQTIVAKDCCLIWIGGGNLGILRTPTKIFYILERRPVRRTGLIS